MEATHAAEIAEHDEKNRILKADKVSLTGENKRQAASDASHNNPHTSPRNGTWTTECRQRRAVEELHARHLDWRPPGRAVGRPGATHKIEPNRPDKHRRHFEYHKRHALNLSEMCVHYTSGEDRAGRGIAQERRDARHGVLQPGVVVDALRGAMLKNMWVGPRAASLH